MITISIFFLFRFWWSRVLSSWWTAMLTVSRRTMSVSMAWMIRRLITVHVSLSLRQGCRIFSILLFLFTVEAIDVVRFLDCVLDEVLVLGQGVNDIIPHIFGAGSR